MKRMAKDIRVWTDEHDHTTDSKWRHDLEKRIRKESKFLREARKHYADEAKEAVVTRHRRSPIHEDALQTTFHLQHAELIKDKQHMQARAQAQKRRVWQSRSQYEQTKQRGYAMEEIGAEQEVHSDQMAAAAAASMVKAAEAAFEKAAALIKAKAEAAKHQAALVTKEDDEMHVPEVQQAPHMQHLQMIKEAQHVEYEAEDEHHKKMKKADVAQVTQASKKVAKHRVAMATKEDDKMRMPKLDGVLEVQQAPHVQHAELIKDTQHMQSITQMRKTRWMKRMAKDIRVWTDEHDHTTDSKWRHDLAKRIRKESKFLREARKHYADEAKEAVVT